MRSQPGWLSCLGFPYQVNNRKPQTIKISVHPVLAAVNSHRDPMLCVMSALMRNTTTACSNRNSAHIRPSACSGRPLWPYETRVIIAMVSDPTNPIVVACKAPSDQSAVSVVQEQKWPTDTSKKLLPLNFKWARYDFTGLIRWG